MSMKEGQGRETQPLLKLDGSDSQSPSNSAVLPLVLSGGETGGLVPVRQVIQ